MAFSQREVAANVAARKVRTTELAKQDADAKAKRDARKAELRSELTKLSIWHENRSHLPTQHLRSRAPEIALQESDYELLKELNEEFLRELNPMTPAQVETAEVAQAQANAQSAVTQFRHEEPLYFPSPRNYQLMQEYFDQHMPEGDISFEGYLAVFREAFSKLYGRLEQRPQGSKPEPVIDRITGAEISPYEVEQMSADEYAARVLGKTTEYSRHRMGFGDCFKR